MKKLFTMMSAVLISATIWAQSPPKMSYQAVIRNNSNQLLTNTQVGMKISILKGLPPTYTVVYWETQTPTTNANGLVSLEIGGDWTGFDTIHWKNGPYFIKTETDPNGGTNYTITGESELLSVPFALHSKTAESVTGGITETDPVFGASPAAGITGTNISNWNNNMLPAGTYQQTLYHDGYSWWTANNLKNDGAVVRINDLEVLMNLDVQTSLNLNALPGTSPMYVISNYKVNNLNADLLDGYHAGDFLTSFAETDPIFTAAPAAGITSGNITNWNSNMLPTGTYHQTLYHNGTSWVPASNMTNDGFDIWINSLTTHFPIEADQGMMSSGPIYINYSPAMPPMYVTSAIKVDNLNVDYLDGKHATDFSAASHVHSDLWSLTGNSGTIPGTNFIGTTDNAPLEFRLGNIQSGKISIGSTFFGFQAGMSQSGPTYNSAFGFQALANTVYGTNNTAIGDNTLYNNNGGYHNTAVGHGTLYTNISGHMNTALGTAAGYFSVGDSNVFLGYQAGYNETGSNKLYIANSNTSTPLIYGNFKTGTLTINNNLNVNNMVGIGTTTPGQKLDVSGGSIRTTGQLISTQATGTAPLAVSSTTTVGNLNADMLDGYHAGNSNGQVPVSNSTVNTNLNADMIDGKHQAVHTEWLQFSTFTTSILHTFYNSVLETVNTSGRIQLRCLAGGTGLCWIAYLNGTRTSGTLLPGGSVYWDFPSTNDDLKIIISPSVNNMNFGIVEFHEMNKPWTSGIVWDTYSPD